MAVAHGFDYSDPGVCICGDAQRLHVLRPLTPWVRLRGLLYRFTGRWCPHLEQVPTVAAAHAAHDHNAAASAVGDTEAVLFCLDCWSASPTNDARALAAARGLGP